MSEGFYHIDDIIVSKETWERYMELNDVNVGANDCEDEDIVILKCN